MVLGIIVFIFGLYGNPILLTDAIDENVNDAEWVNDQWKKQLDKREARIGNKISLGLEKTVALNDPLKILFIGNSYFNYNDLPNLFENLVLSSGKDVFINEQILNGWSLEDHAESYLTEMAINEQEWDYVILIGSGLNIAYPDVFTDNPAYPALVTLRDKIYANCESSTMILCMPWAFEDGMTWYQDWTDTYEDMQILIYENTIAYSEDIGFGIAPVGWAWYFVLEELEYPLHYLHASDMSHPSLKGSYLMACVIFSSVFLESSVNLSYYGELFEEEANYFQVVASDTVLNNLDLWNLNEDDPVFDRGFPIRHAIDGNWAAAQSFIPSYDTLTSVEIYMRKFGTPEFDFTVELRENHPQGPLLGTKVFTPNEVPSNWEWFPLDFSDITVTPETNYFIVCPPAPSGVTTSFGYEWGYTFGNQYDDGAFWFTRDGGGLWRDLPTMYDFVFQTYGTK